MELKKLKNQFTIEEGQMKLFTYHYSAEEAAGKIKLSFKIESSN
jgi:hypothetical protein